MNPLRRLLSLAALSLVLLAAIVSISCVGDGAKARFADDSTSPVAVLSADGWRVLAGDRTAPGRFNGASGVALDAQGNVYVADTDNHRIQKLSPTGQPLAQWGTEGRAPGQFKLPSGVALDAQATSTSRTRTTAASRSSPPRASPWPSGARLAVRPGSSGFP